ncbi:MAG: hypothetical protein ABFD60_17880 [Bryobacteraceae bacterium]
MRAAYCYLVLLAPSLLCAEIIDRIAVTVGNQVITESRVREEIRLTAFLDEVEPAYSVAERRAAAGRLVEQALIRSEIRAGQFAPPAATEADGMVAEFTQEHFKSKEAYQRALKKYDLTERDVQRHFLRQLATLRFIDLRFRPAVEVTDAEMWDYYRYKLVPRWQEAGERAHPFDEVRGEVGEILKQERVDRALDAWILEMRTRVRIEYKEEAFR